MHFSLFTDNFHTLALEGVPIFGLHNRTAAYRFVTLVDVRSMFLIFFFTILNLILQSFGCVLWNCATVPSMCSSCLSHSLACSYAITSGV